jgi:hypothetical protein
MDSYDFFEKEYPDEVRLLLQGAKLEGILQVVPSVIQDLFEHFLEVTVDEGKGSRQCISTRFVLTNTVEHSGSGEYSSAESSTYGSIYNEYDELVMEFNYGIGQAHCCEPKLLHFECYYDEDYENRILNKELDLQEDESTMETDADLKTRTHPLMSPNQRSMWALDLMVGRVIDDTAKILGIERKSIDNNEKGSTMVSLSTRTAPLAGQTAVINGADFIANTIKPTLGETTMSTTRIVNITVIDNNKNIKGAEKIVFKAEGVLTEYNDADTKMNIIATGKVAEALSAHNTDVREETIDKTIRANTGRDVTLEPIEMVTDSQLTWSVIQVG